MRFLKVCLVSMATDISGLYILMHTTMYLYVVFHVKYVGSANLVTHLMMFPFEIGFFFLDNPNLATRWRHHLTAFILNSNFQYNYKPIKTKITTMLEIKRWVLFSNKVDWNLKTQGSIFSIFEKFWLVTMATNISCPNLITFYGDPTYYRSCHLGELTRPSYTPCDMAIWKRYE